MRGHDDHGMDMDRNLCLGSAQDASNDFVQGRARAQEELGLESPDRHLYERAPVGDVAHTSGRARDLCDTLSEFVAIAELI